MTSSSQTSSANLKLLFGFTQFCIGFLQQCHLLDACKTAIMSPLQYHLFVKQPQITIWFLFGGGDPRRSRNAGPGSGSESAGSRFLQEEVRFLLRRSMRADLCKI